ncbi:HI0933 family protein [Ruminiclostridium papyrosolvens DSM 2782]|uniref:HI0933 family protein n=1 Tax=Ruminiclostridium papyrosolvens DSM 2782 TaxID=588581 RepID=F1TA01_9FIRM|nr:NAD(P)/FAD-dependent oxidoreductase [Ruminiclostridium papyrosolvens]EGD48743.1 HI0933 family protein [Ruminiclostridium papyrosolvens DSM 2782]WES32501.1 NAD(P)/FAD-dependent oxidoreductase [Ruminiclostridium papyrosolvens DSM 2782]
MGKVIVIGGGPAGIMAAGIAAGRGRDVILLEKNSKLGKKLLISGKGRCNITNDTDVEGLIENTPGNGNFLYSAFYTFSNQDLIYFFNQKGLRTKVERGGRVFPESDSSRDVLNTLMDFLKSNGVKINTEATVTEILAQDNKVTGVRLSDGSIIEAESVILAVGGMSYPGTGSTGDGYDMVRKLGHTVTPLKPSLVPLITQEEWIKDLQGLSLKNVSVSFRNRNGKEIYNDFGEMIFTHFGVSGPVILSASRHLLSYDFKNIEMSLDLKPALTLEKLDERVQRDFDKYSRKQYKNSLDDLLPQKFIPVIIELSEINPEKPVHQITKEERKRLVTLLKSLKITVIGARPIKEAIVTAGGVKTSEINPSTMESKKIGGLFMAGEVIDVDAYTGGFNLTIAFSTGYLAGLNC